jgi:hypothetical protein
VSKSLVAMLLNKALRADQMALKFANAWVFRKGLQGRFFLEYHGLKV